MFFFRIYSIFYICYMKKSKLIGFLKSLEKEELRQFNDFIASPYFNKSKEVQSLWQYLKPHHPSFPEEAIDKETVFAALFPDVDFEKKKLSYLMNYLLKLGEEFLRIQYFQEHELRNYDALLKQFSRRNLTKHFQGAYQKLTKTTLPDLKESIDNYFYKYLIAEQYSDYITNLHGRKYDNPYLQQTHDLFDQFYYINKIKYCCEMMNRSQIYSTSYNITFVKEVEEILNNSKELPPLLDLYFHIFLFLKNAEDEFHFFNFSETLAEKEDKISKAELRDIYIHPINYSLRKMRNGKEQFTEIALNFYNKGIENRALFIKEVLPYATYVNTYRLALKLEKFDWTEEFIYKYHKDLAEATQKDALHYGLADLYFQKREFREVLANINQMQFGDIEYFLGARLLLLKAYYELDEIDAFLSLLASFTMFLKRNKNISLSLKKACLNFCQVLNKVIKRNPKKLQKIKEEINTIQPLVQKEWLMEKLEEQI